MSAEWEDEKRTEFRKILLDLALPETDLRQDKDAQLRFCLQLTNLYRIGDGGEVFRHFYSDIFAVLISLEQDDVPGSISGLSENLSVIHKEYSHYSSELKDDGHVADCIRKLYDHTNLDVSRLMYLKNRGDPSLEPSKKELDEQITELREQVSRAWETSEASMRKEEELANTVHTVRKGVAEARKLRREIADSKKMGDELRQELEDSKKEYITILGIFASIVLTLTAGITFSTSVLQNIHKASIYRLTGIIVLVAMVLINILFLLVHYIDKLVHDRQKENFAPLIAADIFLGLVLLFIVIAWSNGAVESRDQRIMDDSYQVSSAEMESNILE